MASFSGATIGPRTGWGSIVPHPTEEGALVLIEPSKKEYLERGRFEQPDRTDKPAWAHPVIANGKLYVRDQETLFGYDIGAVAKTP